MTLFRQNFLRCRRIFEEKKSIENIVFEQFLKTFGPENCVFFGARSPLKLVKIGAKAAFRKLLGLVTANMCYKITNT